MEFAKLSNQFGDLEGIELARKVLTQSGKIGIDEENKIIYSSHKLGGLLGYNLAEIASLAYNVDTQDLTATQVMFVKYALDNLAIDTMYPYGSLNNVKATILNRVAITTMDDALIQELGTGAEPFILDQLILNNKKYTTLNFENLVKDYIYLNFKHNGLLVKTDSNSTVDDSAIKQSLYQGLLDLDEVQSKLSEHFLLLLMITMRKLRLCQLLMSFSLELNCLNMVYHQIW